MAKKTAKKETLISRLEKVSGIINKNVVSEMGDAPIARMTGKLKPVPCFSSGSITLDAALGGGYPWGRIVEIFGPESGGKTTLMLHAIANVQKEDPEAIVAFIDAEHSLDLYYANALGVKVPNLLVSQPESGEQAFDIIFELLKLQAKLIVVDSVAALTPKAILKDGMDQKSMGLQARLMSQGISKINPLLHQFGSTVLFTNQIRESIGGMSQGYVTPGGRTLRFYASQRIDVKRIGSSKEGDEVVNNVVVAKVAKNKVARPFQKAEFKIVFGKGIDRVEQAIDLGVKYDIIEKSGAWFKYGGESFQGAKNLRPFLEENPKEVESVISKIRAAINEADLVEESMHLKSEEPPVVPEPEDAEETEAKTTEEVTELGSGKEEIEVSQV